MTISTTLNRIEYVGNGVTTGPYSFPYAYLSFSYLVVYVNGVIKTKDVDYTASDTDPLVDGCTITFSVAPANAVPIVIYCDPDLLQSSDLPTNGSFPSQTVESMSDKLTLITQRLKAALLRTVRLSDSDVSGASTVLPTPSSLKLLGWDIAGTKLENFDPALLSPSIINSNTLLQRINSWASIATVTPTAAGQLFSLAQHTSGGLGGGTLISVAGSVTDDGGTQKNALGGFYLKRINSPFYSPKHYGCLGDGSTDDTVNFQKLLTSAPSGSFIYIEEPLVTYKITAPLTLSGKAMEIVGPGLAAGGITFYGSTTDACLTISPGDILRAVSVTDLAFYAGNASVASGRALAIVYPTTATWPYLSAKLSNIGVYSNASGATLPYWNSGIYIDNCWNAELDNIWVNLAANDAGTLSTLCIQVGANCTDTVINNAHLFFGAAGISATAYVEGLRISDSVIVGNYRCITNNASSFGMLGLGISDCHLNAKGIPIDVRGSNQSSIHDILLYNSDVGSVAAWQMIDCNDCIIHDIVAINSAGTPNGGIFSFSSTSCSRNKIHDINFEGYSTGVLLNAGTSGNDVQNIVRAGAGVRSLPVTDNGTGNFVKSLKYTSNAAITFTGGAAFENKDIAIPAGYFFNKPLYCTANECGNTGRLIGFYLFGDAASTSTNVRVRFERNDGAVIAGGGYQIQIYCSE